MNKLNICLPVYPFPTLRFWQNTPETGNVTLDVKSGFKKSTYFNRYYIANAQGLQLLSIPLINGRHQSNTLDDVKIDYTQTWQKTHWRSLMAAYAGTPYYEYYAPSLQVLFHEPIENLVAFNLKTLQWCAAQLKRKIFFLEAESLCENVLHLPRSRKEEEANEVSKYYQIFSDRVGFVPHLSILDALMNEGPQTSFYCRERII